MTTRGSSQNSDKEGSSWCTVESDPGVFTELISEIGVKGVQVEEIYELDKKFIEDLQPLYGLIFLFKWRPERDDRVSTENYNLFFAKQVINNACATQAILSILLNCPEIDIGEELTQFKNFTKDFPPELKGLAISNSEPIRKAHNSFARPEPFTVGEEVKPVEEDDDEVYHFISYVPFNGILYELDGLKSGPISLGECTKEDWLDKIFPMIQKRIEKYASSEIRFNLMAIIKDRKFVYNEQIRHLEQQKQENQSLINNLQNSEMDIDIQSPTVTLDDLNTKQSFIDQKIVELKHQIDLEDEKFKNWKVENIRRKHNYIPFFVNLLKILAEKGELLPLIQKASRRP